MSDGEQELAGGNSAAKVLRVGQTVRKPWRPGTPAVIDFMAAVRSAGVDVPAVLGRDDQGRLMLEFVPGRLAMDLEPLALDSLARVGGIVRAIHDASVGFVPTAPAIWDSAIAAPDGDLICHGDLAPWNLVIGERWVFIDWDASAPSTRLWDLAYAAQTFALNDPNLSPGEAGERLAAFAGGYRADSSLRLGLPGAIVDRVRAMHDLLRSSHSAGVEPWGSMYLNGHGAHWHAVLDYVQSNTTQWSRALADDQSR